MVKFTESYISKLQPDTNKARYEIQDEGCPGLYCRVTDKGAKTYCFFRRINGKLKRVTIAKTCDINLKDARKQALEYYTQISNGIDPNKEKQKLKNEICLADLFSKYIEEHGKKYTKQSTWKENQNIYNRYLLPWKNKTLISITRDDIEKLHTKLSRENGIYAANSTLTLIKHIFNKAIEWGWQGNNPAIGIKKLKEKSRDRYLQPDEIVRFFNALSSSINDTTRDFFYMLIYTGQRRSNVLSMSWDDISLKNKIWHIPDTKNGEPLNVPLVNKAVDILTDRYAKKDNNISWVFPSNTSISGHLEEPKKAWKNILEEANIADLRIHDIRRTLGSYQAISGSSLHIIGKSLGHKSTQATEIYARLSQDPVRASMEKAIDMIESFTYQDTDGASDEKK